MRAFQGLLSACLIGSAALAFAEERPREIVGNLIYLKSQPILGSMDSRYGGGVSVQWLNPSRKLSFRGSPAKLNVEGYALATNTNFAYGKGKQALHTGVLVSGRYEYGKGSTKYFWEAGWGLNYSSRPTHDLESSFNSTPTIGIGAILNSTYVTLRLMHMSNGGLSGKHNKGQNMLQLMIGFRL